MTQPTAPTLERPRLFDPYDFQASPSVAWVIDVELPRPMHRDRFLPLFMGDWRLENNVSLHAFCPDTSFWMYPESSGMPERYTRLQLGVALSVPREVDELEALLAEIRGRLEGAGITDVRPRTTAVEAAARAEVLDEMLEDLEEAEAGVILAAAPGTPFALGDVARVLGALGLREGDREEGFAWPNGSDAPGDEDLFTVLPEHGPGDTVKSLRFALHVARTAEPTTILDQLLIAAEHARAALGGSLEGLAGEPFDAAQTRAWVGRIAARLTAADLEPGAYHTMTVF